MDGMIAMLPAPLQKLSSHIDFQGQKVAERTYQVILTIAGIVGFFVGFWTQQLSYAIHIVMGASAFTALIILPPWPFLFRKNPIVWQVPTEEQEETSSASPPAESSAKKDDKKKKEPKKTK
uniref:Signal peptidase complex subunit 1 n=1 Tax=Caenorhabditis tropicalis TaxID=1561998 RepID=A0A1I7UG90_9PELO